MKLPIKFLLALLGLVLALPLFFPGDIPLMFGIALLAMIIATAGSVALKKATWKQTGMMWAAYFTLFTASVFYVVPSQAISQGAGTVLSDNWWVSLNWMRENTAECSTIATYWDPGHFIRAIAKRASVFDGASQNSLFEKPINQTSPNGIRLERYDNGIVQIIQEKDGKLARARIKDIATSMMTSNETLALEILKDYRKPGCDEMYFLASSDLIFKSVWWSYFATWDPTKQDPKGNQHSYFIANLARRKPILALDVVGYEYPLSGSQSVILCQANGTIAPCRADQGVGAIFQDGQQFVRIERVVFPRGNSYVQITDPAAELKGTVLVLDPSAQTIVFLPTQLQDSMFTRMFFFNGAGLSNFELVNAWGGEIKLFRVRFDD
jgi:dolichyl-diphosphooligosaccharide--protein glycosyltransferase